MQRLSHFRAAVLTCAVAPILLAFSGCMGNEAPSGGEQLAVVPVSGKVTVNGAPAPKGPIRVMMIPTGSQLETKPGQEVAATPSALAWTDGSFKITTYASNDGAPPGEYKLVFSAPTFTLTRGYDYSEEGDQLKGAFSDPEKSEHTVKVEQSPVVIPPIDLKTDLDVNSFIPGAGYNQ